MARGESGRIVLEIDPSQKGDLYSALTRDGLTLKDWFLRQAELYLRDRDQIPLFVPSFVSEESTQYKVKSQPSSVSPAKAKKSRVKYKPKWTSSNSSLSKKSAAASIQIPLSHILSFSYNFNHNKYGLLNARLPLAVCFTEAVEFHFYSEPLDHNPEIFVPRGEPWRCSPLTPFCFSVYITAIKTEILVVCHKADKTWSSSWLAVLFDRRALWIDSTNVVPWQ